MKFNYKKLASVLTSAVMLGSTVGLAAAASYSPFIKDGSANVAVVVGANAAATDLLAASDITGALQVELAKQTATASTSSTSSVSGGDYVKLTKTSSNLNLGDTLSTIWGSSISKDDLKVLLADGTYKNKQNTEYKYEQKVALGNALTLNYFADSNFKSNQPSLGINLASGAAVVNYTLDFTTDPTSSVATDQSMTDIETTTLNILGKSYYVLDARNGTAAKLVLLDSANTAIIADGEKKTITVGAKSYDVEITYIDSSKVKLIVNGETTESLSSGGTYKLSDATYIGVKDILASTKSGTIDKVEISIGSGKLELNNGQQVKLNDKSLNELTGWVITGGSGTTATLDKVIIEWKTDDKRFIADGNSLTLPGFSSLKLSLGNFTTPKSEITEVKNGGSDYIQLKTTIKDGDVTIPILQANSSGEFKLLGRDSSNKLVTSNTSSLNFSYDGGDRYFVASWNASKDAESYYLALTSVVNDNGINRTTLRKYVDGAWSDVSADRTAGDSINIGSASITISAISKATNSVNITGGNGVSFNTLYTKAGLKVQLPYITANNDTTSPGAVNLTYDVAPLAGHSSDSFVLFFTEADKDGNVAKGSAFNVTLNDKSDGLVEVSSVDTGRSLLQDQSNTNNYVGMIYSDLATTIWRLGDSSSQRSAKIIYSGGESYADAFLTAPSASVSSSGSSGTGVKTLGTVTIKDNEAASVTGKNLIVVGGSCINSVAAKLLGGALCGADFEAATKVGAGQFLIKTYSQSDGTVATLVAGYNAADTSNAAKYFATSTVDASAGKAYVGTSATSATLLTTSN